jgi:hypothetical protein
VPIPHGDACRSRLPIIRHIRWLYYSYQVDRHYEMWREINGSLPVYRNHDEKVLDGIWRGER